MSRRKAYYARKMKIAAHLLFFKRHRKPGAKGWELRKKLGSDYPKVLNILDSYLKKLDLQVKRVFEEDREINEPSREQLDSANYYVTLREDVTLKEAKMMGWRVDDIAGLAITLSHILSRQGRASREEVVKLLREKMPNWRVNLNLDRYIRVGYIFEDDNKQLSIDWRTRAEIDREMLVELLLSEQQ